MQQVAESQSEKLAEELKKIKQNITADDRKECVRQGFSKTLISLYLNGDVRNNDTAVKMLTIFRTRIAQRESIINGTKQQ